MKNISYWAKSHPNQARWLITLSHCILIPLAFFLGFQLWLEDFRYSPLAHDILTTLFVLGLLGYPIKGATSILLRHSYQRQKTFDFVLIITGFLSLATFTSMRLEQASLTAAEGRAVRTSIEAPGGFKSGLNYLKENMSWHALKKNARMLKKEILQTRKLAQNENGAAKVLGTILILLAAFFLGYLIVAWACSLSCSGQEGAANVVLIGGGALLLLLTILGLRAIWKNRVPDEAPKVE